MKHEWSIQTQQCHCRLPLNCEQKCTYHRINGSWKTWMYEKQIKLFIKKKCKRLLTVAYFDFEVAFKILSLSFDYS